MTSLTAKHYELIQQYEYIVYVAYKKLNNIEDLANYREEIISEGYYALCLAVPYLNKEVKKNPFSYLFKCTYNAMALFIKEFIYQIPPTVGFDDLAGDTNLCLADVIPDDYNFPEIESYIDDLVTEYIELVKTNPEFNNQCKTHITKPTYIEKLKTIITMLSQGYDGKEIGILLGCSRQAVNLHLQRLRKVLAKSNYRVVD